MSPRLTAAITVAIHELKRRPYSTIRNDTVAELEAALAAEEKAAEVNAAGPADMRIYKLDGGQSEPFTEGVRQLSPR